MDQLRICLQQHWLPVLEHVPPAKWLADAAYLVAALQSSLSASNFMLFRPFIHTMRCFAAPISDLRAVGGFNPRPARFSDLDLYARLLAGAQRRGPLAWTRRPFVVIPHVAVLKEIHLVDRPLGSYSEAWEKNKRRFLDEVFSYSFMRGRRGLRGKSEGCLDEGQRQFFANFA